MGEVSGKSRVAQTKGRNEPEKNDQTIGQMLRAARLNKGLSLTAISKNLKIKKSFIDAMEKERYGDLPGPTYAIGFVRSYAKLLDLDQVAIVERFRSEIAPMRPMSSSTTAPWSRASSARTPSPNPTRA